MWLYQLVQGKEQLDSAVPECATQHIYWFFSFNDKFPLLYPGGKSMLLLSELWSFSPESFTFSTLAHISDKFDSGVTTPRTAQEWNSSFFHRGRKKLCVTIVGVQDCRVLAPAMEGSGRDSGGVWGPWGVSEVLSEQSSTGEGSALLLQVLLSTGGVDE